MPPYITKEEMIELEGPVYAKRWYILLGAVGVFILSIVLGSISPSFYNITFMAFLFAIGWPFYVTFFRQSKRKVQTDGISVDHRASDRLESVRQILTDNGLINPGFEIYHKITVNLSTKYTKKFETYTLFPIIDKKKALAALHENNVTQKKKGDKLVKHKKVQFFKNGMALEKEVVDASHRGYL
ncbi:MAG: hypothetical protein ACXAD7_03985 [Candidatus Kariarchaeaceae archaeon]|jgi:hypothetical protein